MPAQGAEKGGQDVINYTTALVAWVLKIAMIILTTTSKKKRNNGLLKYTTSKKGYLAY